MKLYWHNNQKSRQLLLIFNGWGCDENIIKDLQKSDYDILLVYDYTTIEPEKLECTQFYGSVVLIAWSFGVFVANYCKKSIYNTSKKIAVNGTLLPVDDSCGIPNTIFQVTLQTYNDQTCKKFFLRIMGGQNQYNANLAYLPKLKTKNQLEELTALTLLFGNTDNNIFYWDRAILSKSDKIFPYPNMKRAWGDKAYSVDGDHFINFQLIVNEYV